MNVTLKQNMLLMVGVITLCSLLGYVVLIYSAHLIGNDLRIETQNHIKSLISKNARQIEAAMQLMEQNASDLAGAGEAFLTIHRRTGADITPAIKDYLLDNFRGLPNAVGGGLWYEPFVMMDKQRYGPYVYREKDQIRFTWDLNTPAYDYHNQSWYRLAIPKQWDRSQKRPRKIYWTDPYLDEAATEALMITVDALMTNPEDGIIGMATVDLSLEDLQTMVARMTVTANSRPFAVDTSSDLLIAYPADPDRLLTRVSDLDWGTALEALHVQPDKVSLHSVQIEGADFSLFTTGTGTGFGVGILSPDQELFAELNHLRNVILTTSIGVIALQITLFLLVALFMVKRVCNPIGKLTGVARQIAQGDLKGSAEALMQVKESTGSHQDETGQLLVSFEEMTAKLNALLAQVQQAGNQVAASSNEISTSSTHLEANISDQAVSAGQISASSKQISATTESLAGTMNEVSSAASETASLAESGQKGLGEMETTMQGVLQGTASISDRLTDIKENGAAISSIVTTITKVADQTNLLSLNAAIEAEKAGEYGRGFSVVADEIRRLADQTSVAVLDIEEMINRMESSVSAGATEMEDFSQDVGSAVRKINDMGKQLDGIMERVRTLTPRFESVNTGMETQSESAVQISETMDQLNTLTQNTLESIREFKRTAQYLNTAASDLQEEVSRFKVDGQMQEGTD